MSTEWPAVFWSPCYQKVTCRLCGATYVCTVERDYYNSTSAFDGVCGGCLLHEARL